MCGNCKTPAADFDPNVPKSIWIWLDWPVVALLICHSFAFLLQFVLDLNEDERDKRVMDVSFKVEAQIFLINNILYEPPLVETQHSD